jgi:starch phosphorylase
MVRDYVRTLYAPAAHTARGLNSDFHGAAELAVWTKRVRAAWPAVHVEHVESSGVGDAPEVGAMLTVRAFVALGELTPDDVDVQVVHGTTTSEDTLVEASVTTTPMTVAEAYEAGRYRFDAPVSIERSGAFGYTVRVVPRHEALASVAELGLVALPPMPDGPA